MIVETVHSGQIDVGESDIVRFERGLPGFENLKQFVLIKLEEGLPYVWLQSLENTDIAMLLANPFVFYPEYDWRLSELAQQELQLSDVAQLEVWSIVTLASDFKDSSINLLAPVLINRNERIGIQHILHDNHYQTKHPLIRAEHVTATEIASDGQEG